MFEKFVITAKGRGGFEQEKEPVPRKGQILCRPRTIGLCGTDKLIFNGEMPAVKYPRTPCHEASAVVISNNSDLNIKPGTAVCVDPYNNCGKCYACRSGRNNCCEFNQTLGVQREGLLKERFVVEANRVHVIPDGIDPRLFCLAEPLALALHIVKRGKDVHKGWCLVIGAGNVGSLLISVLSAMKAKVIACDIAGDKLSQAKSLGAQIVVDANAPDIKHQIFDITGGDGVAVAFETAGQSKTLEACIQWTAFGGRVVVVGHSKQISNIYGSEIVFKELNVVGSRNSQADFPDAIKMLAENPDCWGRMISHRFLFEDSLKAFELIRKGNQQHAKVVIDLPD